MLFQKDTLGNGQKRRAKKFTPPKDEKKVDDGDMNFYKNIRMDFFTFL